MTLYGSWTSTRLVEAAPLIKDTALTARGARLFAAGYCFSSADLAL